MESLDRSCVSYSFEVIVVDNNSSDGSQDMVRQEFPKVKPSIQGDAVRVSGKSKDDLQRVISRLRQLDESSRLRRLRH